MDNIQFEAVPAHELGDRDLAARILKKLYDAYPGYTWKLRVSDELLDATVDIVNVEIHQQLFTNNTYAYKIFLSTIYQDPELKCVLRAGGEWLERAYLARGKNKGEIIKKVDGIPDSQQPISKKVH